MQISLNNNATDNDRFANAEILVDNFGNPLSSIPTYQVQVFDITPVAGATDILQIIGSATKTIKITRIKITASATAAAAIDFYSFKRTTLNVGGTITHPAIVKYDSLNADPTATINLYSANPSALGNGVMLGGTKFMIPGTNGNTWFPVIPIIVEYGTRNNSPVILRGVNESLAISLNGQTIPSGLQVYASIEWCEE